MNTMDEDKSKHTFQVLYIEDDPAHLSIVSDLLADEEFECIGTTTAEEGLKICEKTDPDTILLDLTLPGGMFGLQALQIFKERWPDREVIVVSGTGKDEDLVQCVNEGAFRYHPKPVNLIELLADVRSAAEIYRLRETEKQHKVNLEELVIQRTQQWRQSHNRFIALYNSLNLVFVTNEQGVILDVNQAVCDTLHYNTDELLGKSFKDIEHPEREAGSEMADSSGEDKSIPIDFDVELKLKKRDGSPLYIQGKEARIDESDEYIYVCKDTTESVETFHTLEENKSNLQDLNDRLVRLIQSTNKMAQSNQLDKIGQTFLEVFASNMDSEGGSIYRVTEDGLVLLHSIGKKKAFNYIEFPLRDKSIFSMAINQKSPILVKDIKQNSSIKKSGGEYKNDSVLVFPILNDTRNIITLVSLHNKKNPPFTEQDQKIGQILASYTYESIRSVTISDKLKESEEMYRILVENANDGIVVIQDSQLVFHNPKLKEMLVGKSTEGQDVSSGDIIDAYDIQNIEEIFKEMLKNGENQRRKELKIKKKSGDDVWLEANGIVIEWNSDPAFLIFLSDVTQRKEAEKILQESHDVLEHKVAERTAEIKKTNELLEAEIQIRKQAEEERLRLIEILEATTDLVLISDFEYRILYMNLAARSIFGIPINDKLTDYRFHQLYPPSAFAIVRDEGIPEAIKTGSWVAESTLKNAEDVEIPVSQVLMAHRDPDDSLAYLSTIIRDITQQKQVELELTNARRQAETANQAKSDFLSNISHELRTPMHHILNFSKFGLTKKDINPEKTLEYFTKINRSGRSLMGLLNALLDLSKMEAGKTEYKLTPQNLYSLTLEVVEEFQHSLEERSIKLTVIQPDMAALTNCDGYAIKEVIRNLISNAIKFSDVGKTITIYLEFIETQAGRRSTDKQMTPAVEFSIEDEGIGIPPDELETVFDKFVQSSKTRTGAGGTGLGLSISKEIVTAHKGRIWAENAGNGGAIFRFYIPREQPGID